MSMPRTFVDALGRKGIPIEKTPPIETHHGIDDDAWSWDAAYFARKEGDIHFRFILENEKHTQNVEVDIHYSPDVSGIKFVMYVLKADGVDERSADALSELFGRVLRRAESERQPAAGAATGHHWKNRTLVYVDSAQKNIIVRAILSGLKKHGWILDEREKTRAAFMREADANDANKEIKMVFEQK